MAAEAKLGSQAPGKRQVAFKQTKRLGVSKQVEETEPLESKSLETEQKKPVQHEQILRAPQQQVHQQNL